MPNHLPGITFPSALAVTVGLLAGCGGSSQEREALPSPPPTDIRGDYHVDARLANGVVTVVVPREGSRRVLDSRRHLETAWGFVIPPPSMEGFVSREYLLSENHSDGKTLVFANVEQNDSDPADYLVAGWWMHFPAGVERNDIANAERQVFFAGPELDAARPPRLPTAGSAVYSGQAGGLYEYTYGADSTFADQRGTTEFAEVYADARLNVDFSNGSIRGCIGCDGDVTAQTYYLYPILPWRGDPPAALPKDYEITLESTVLESNGVFEEPNVIVSHPTRNIETYSGRWGGQLSNVPDSQNRPRRASGIAEVRFAESDGSEGKFDFGFGSLFPDSGG
ncbi:MAG: hypothetical protein OXF07_13455 [Rhodobacter sp.]|nr:hypothetical protein [Rhodobacter sp.]MCY4166875.1 hypothetical protein [Rhodobacter sp.]MCY4240686.1 hypothetical protein [Rhodobacter sp.]